MKNNKLEIGKIYRVEWYDSYFIHGWHGLDEIKDIIAENKKEPDFTVGVLIYQDKDFIALAESCSSINSYAETMVIPKKMIISYKELT